MEKIKYVKIANFHIHLYKMTLIDNDVNYVTIKNFMLIILILIKVHNNK